MSTDAQMIDPLLDQRRFQRVRVVVAVAVVMQLALCMQLGWGPALLLLPLAIAALAVVSLRRYGSLAASMAGVCLASVGAGLAVAVPTADDPVIAFGALALFGMALPAFAGLGVRMASAIGGVSVTGALVLHSWTGGGEVGALAALLYGGVLVGGLAGWQAERVERADLRAQVELQHARTELLWQAQTDPLTGLSNRLFVQDWLEQVCEQSRRTRGAVSVLMIDIDRFKQINDRWGHPTGDVVIRVVATALRRACGPRDLVGRWGGEEFVVVLDDCPAEQAWSTAECLRGAVEAMEIATDDDDGPVIRTTVSVGPATWDGTDVLEPHQLIERADRAMYAAKESGRNRVGSAPG